MIIPKCQDGLHAWKNKHLKATQAHTTYSVWLDLTSMLGSAILGITWGHQVIRAAVAPG